MSRRSRKRIFLKLITAVMLAALSSSYLPVTYGIGRPEFKPGFNFFTPKQDVQLGKETATQIEEQLLLLHSPDTESYLNDLGKKLLAFVPNSHPEYVWQFKVVNSPDINAFALPGGFIYVNRGAIEAAENEAELAGVIAHEAGHVVMRHGTHMASQAVLAQGGMALISQIMGQDSSLAGQLAQLGLGLGVNSLLLKNSRSAEAQADEVGTYVLYQAGYDPHAMVRFFQIIAARYPQRTAQFFSDHPNPENRIKDVDAEIAKLGPGRGYVWDSPAFELMKEKLAALAPAPAKGAPKIEQPPAPPSANFLHYDGKLFSMDYPDNWQLQRAEDGVLMFPPGGMQSSVEGGTTQAYGVAVSLYMPQQPDWGLLDATQELLSAMRQANPQMRELQQTGLNLRGNPAISTMLENASPFAGENETDRLVTVRQHDAVLAFTFIVPASAPDVYGPTFDRMLRSIELTR